MSLMNEYNGIIRSLLDKLEFLRASGISELHVPLSTRAEAGQKDSGPETKEAASLDEIRAEASSCTGCSLHRGRTKVVSGKGNPKAVLFFAGSAPDESDDISGEPFSGEAGEQLSRILKYMGFERKDVYITYALKCKAGKEDLNEEVNSCRPFLEKEIRAVAPKVIVALGPQAALALLGGPDVKGLRGRFHLHGGIKVMPTYDPALLIKRPELKKEALADINLVIKELKNKS